MVPCAEFDICCAGVVLWRVRGTVVGFIVTHLYESIPIRMLLLDIVTSNTKLLACFVVAVGCQRLFWSTVEGAAT